MFQPCPPVCARKTNSEPAGMTPSLDAAILVLQVLRVLVRSPKALHSLCLIHVTLHNAKGAKPSQTSWHESALVGHFKVFVEDLL